MKKLLAWINEFSKVAGCEINIQKSIIFQHTSNKQSKNEIQKTIPYTVSSIYYLGINLKKKVQNSKPLLKEIKRTK